MSGSRQRKKAMKKKITVSFPPCSLRLAFPPRENADALILSQSSFTNFHRKQLAPLGIKGNLLTMCESARWTEDGCIMSYGPDLPYQYPRAAVNSS